MYPSQNPLLNKIILFTSLIYAIYMTTASTNNLLYAQDNIQQRIFLPIINVAANNNQVADISAPQVEIPEQYKSLFDKARQAGSVMVIVGLVLPRGFQAEGDVGRSAMLTEQRAAIAQTQQELLYSLIPYKASAYAVYETVPAIAIEVDSTGLQALLTSPLVLAIEEDIPSVPTLDSSTVVIGAPTAWTAGYEGAGQTVVILDTGIDGDHPFFSNRIVTQACFSNDGGKAKGVSLCPNGKTSQTGNNAAEAQIEACNNGDLCAHGSHVAGIAAGDGTSYDGVARKASIIAIQVFTRLDKATDCAPNSAPCVKSWQGDQIKALDYINKTLSTSYKIASVNMSLGGPPFYTDQKKCDTDNSNLKKAIDNLRSKRIATIISSGNDEKVNQIAMPACISTAIAVGATTDVDQVASFSNMHAMVDLLAPGVDIKSSIPGGGFASYNGTSQAAPHVTGAWAVLKAINPLATVDTILSTLQSTGISVKDTRSGGTITKPRIQLDKAIPQKPTAPSNLRATALDLSRIQLNWNDNSNNETGFTIYDGDTFVANVGANTVSYTATGLAPGSYHCYHLYAYNNSGSSAWTEWACAITLSSTAGFDSQFNGSAPGWFADSGSWFVDAYYLTSSGLTAKWATVHQEKDYSNFDFETMVWRNGCNNCSSGVFFRGTPAPVDSLNRWYKGYLLTFTRDGYYALWSTRASSSYAIQGWTFSNAIHQGSDWNMVRIKAVGSNIIIYFNGTWVWSGSNVDHSTGKIGLGMYQEGSNNQIWFDYAKLTPATAAAASTEEEVNPEQQALNEAAAAQSNSSAAMTDMAHALDNRATTSEILPNIEPPAAPSADVVNLPESTEIIPTPESVSQQIYLPLIQYAATAQ